MDVYNFATKFNQLPGPGLAKVRQICVRSKHGRAAVVVKRGIQCSLPRALAPGAPRAKRSSPFSGQQYSVAGSQRRASLQRCHCVSLFRFSALKARLAATRRPSK
jgi:hypothetical protein